MNDLNTHNDKPISTSRRDFLLDTLAVSGVVATSLSLPSTVFANSISDTQNVLRLGYLPNADATPLLVAYANGYFAEEGLKVAPPESVSSWASLIQGFVTGQFDLIHLVNPIQVWSRHNHQFPSNDFAIAVGKDTDIQSLADLAGKQVGVPYWYSMHNLLLQSALQHIGLKPVIKGFDATLAKEEVNLHLVKPSMRASALEAKRIDASIVAQSTPEKALPVGTKRLSLNTPKNDFCCTEQTLSAKPGWTQKVMNATLKAQRYTQQHREQVTQMLSQTGQNYIPISAPALKRAMLAHDSLSSETTYQPWQHGRIIDLSPSATRLLMQSVNQTFVVMKV